MYDKEYWKWYEKIEDDYRKYTDNWYGSKLNNENNPPDSGDWEKIKKQNLRFNLNNRIRGDMRKFLRRNIKGKHWEELVGYTMEDLKKRLLSTIPNGYTWQDFLKGKLHIDHKIPISVFDYTKTEDLNFKMCWTLNNLQLLPAKENMRKGDKLSKPFQLILQI